MKPISLSVLLLLALILTSCTTTRYPRDERKRDDDRRDKEGRNYPFSALGIPKGHLPPPGECKIWLPGREQGQQGPPLSCGSALRNAPLCASVITHEGGKYKVYIFNRTRRNVIDEVRYYLSNQAV